MEMEMEMELDLNAVVETVAAVRCDDSAASSALNAASGTVEASAGGSSPWQQQPMALTFTILRPDDGGGTPGQQQLVTQELFPVMPPGRWGGSGLWEPGGAVEQAAKKKSRRGPRSRSSEYRGVTFYRRTSRWESHIWDCGKQVYLGGFDTAHAAARRLSLEIPLERKEMMRTSQRYLLLLNCQLDRLHEHELKRLISRFKRCEAFRVETMEEKLMEEKHIGNK